MTKRALVLLAQGAEEMEAIITVDVLRRSGIEVLIASLSDNLQPVKCSRDVSIVPDTTLSKVAEENFDVIVLPGGKDGTQRLCESVAVGNIVRKQLNSHKLVAAICAAPLVFSTNKLCHDKKLTSHWAVKDDLKGAGYKYLEEKVIVDGNVVTSRGPGTAFNFALKIVELLLDKKSADSMLHPLMLDA